MRFEDLYTQLAYVNNSRAERPWGYYCTLIALPIYKVKFLVIKPGGALSLQKHLCRSETWNILEGTPTIFLGSMAYEHEELAIQHGMKFTMTPNDKKVVEVAMGQWHRIWNNSEGDVVILEVQRGDCREEDIIRKEDIYGRV